MRSIVAGLALGASLCLVAGCSGGGPSSEGPSNATSTATSPTPSATPSGARTPKASASGRKPGPSRAASSATSASSTPSTPVRADVDLSRYSLAGVMSPSKDIACLFAEHPLSVRCDLQQADWDVKTPASCSLRYGDSVELSRGKARLSCHGDTVFGAPHQDVLAYGKTARFRDLRCTSEQAGMTCQDGAGHGFTVSENGYDLR